MIVAVSAMRVVEVALHQIVDVIRMWHRFVAAAGTVGVAGGMSRAIVIRRALHRIRVRCFDRVLVDMVAMHVVQMAVVQVIDMIAMPYGDVTAAGTMFVRVFAVVLQIALIHREAPFFVCAVGSEAWFTPLWTKLRTWSSARA